MIRLEAPGHALHSAWVQCMREFDGAVLHGFSTHRFDVDELAEPEGFERWLDRERRLRVGAVDDLVPATVWWIVDDAQPGRVLGSIHLRHRLDDWLLAEGGHIGFGIRPSARGRGAARGALRLVLERASAMGMERVLLCCDADNRASQSVINGVGGALEDVRGGAARYWVPLPGYRSSVR